MANPLLPPLLGTAFTSIAAPVVTFFLTRGSGSDPSVTGIAGYLCPK